MTEEQFSRKNAREPWTKTFAIASDDLRGDRHTSQYEKIPEFVNANKMHEQCWTRAKAYADGMLIRLLREEPEYFEDKPVSKEEFALHLQNNICLPVTKYKNAVFADTTAQLVE